MKFTTNDRDRIIERFAMGLPADEPALLSRGRDALRAYDAAIRNEDELAAEDARQHYEATVWKLNGETWFGCQGGPESGGPRLAIHCAAQLGDDLLWAQKGAMIITVDGMRAVWDQPGGFHLGFGGSWNAIDLNKPFVSDTGFWSYLSAPVIWGATLREACEIWLRSEMSSKERKPRPIPASAYCRTRPDRWADLEEASLPKPVTARMPANGFAAFPL